METISEHITSCMKHIEQRFGRGCADTWDTNDFVELSKSIQKKTGTLLSVSTLKRLSGKINYSSQPNKATLNTLAKYIDYTDWTSFISSLTERELSTIKKSRLNIPSRQTIVILLFVLVLLSAAYWSIDPQRIVYHSNDFSFSGESVTIGLPNSVVFKYDASAAHDEAKIEIQQDWDENRRVRVSKTDSVLTSIYYRPGFFQSKLVVDGKTVKEKDILIPTDDWVGVIETDSIPIYLDKEDYLNENGLAIKADVLKKYGVDPRSSKTPVGLYQIQDFGDLYTTDFELSASIRNDFKSGISICQSAQLVIVHEDGPISIMLTDRGCISDIMLHAFGKTVNGKKADLSSFGVDFSDFVNLKCISNNGRLDILIDDQIIYSFEVSKPSKKILGCSIHFEGAGTVQKIELRNSNGLYYLKDF